MWRALVAAALVLGCGREPRERPRTDDPIAPVASVVPVLPRSPDGLEELRALDREIDLADRADADERLIAALLRRSSVRGGLQDYEEAVWLSAAWLARAPRDPAALKTRVTALTRVHQFTMAREALERFEAVAIDPNDVAALRATLDEATGHPERAAAYREQTAMTWPHPSNLTMRAANLALQGKTTAAIAEIPRAAAAVRDNSPLLVAWLLFQWGRLYELDGQHAAARQLFEAAHARLPGYVDATVHLAAAIAATGGDPRTLVTDALAHGRHPELLALAGLIDEAKVAWERYLTALPEAFADHGARFYLGAGGDPARALVLARANLANRDTLEARSLVVDAALAAHQASVACEVVAPLRQGARRYQLVAWRALSACGRPTDAAELARTLGIQ